MHWGLCAGLCAVVISFLLAVELAIHQHYQRSMSASLKRFERKWNELEKEYERKI